jgi:hypothetical protein
MCVVRYSGVGLSASLEKTNMLKLSFVLLVLAPLAAEQAWAAKPLVFGGFDAVRDETLDLASPEVVLDLRVSPNRLYCQMDLRLYGFEPSIRSERLTELFARLELVRKGAGTLKPPILIKESSGIVYAIRIPMPVVGWSDSLRIRTRGGESFADALGIPVAELAKHSLVLYADPANCAQDP